MKVLVLGASGMLGNAVMRVLSENKGWQVFGTVRSGTASRHFPPDIAASLVAGVDVEDQDTLVRVFASVRPDVVINCIGLIKQLADGDDPLLALPINAMLPHRLARLCELAGIGMRVEALSANPAVLTCLANDLGYDLVYAEQLRVKANPGDVLIVFSGSGNSPNVVKALEMGNTLGMKTFAVLGYSGGKCKEVAQHPIHFAVDDMQIAEDLQLIVGHMCMQWLCANPDD